MTAGLGPKFSQLFLVSIVSMALVGFGGCRAESRYQNLRSECSSGGIESCIQVSEMLTSGDGVAQDLGMAERILVATCMAGSEEGCRAAVNLHREFNSPDLNLDYLTGMFRASCETVAVGCAVLAEMYLEPVLVERDSHRARAYATTSCSYDVALGCEVLANIYQDGIGIERDGNRSQEFRDRACQLGRQTSCH